MKLFEKAEPGEVHGRRLTQTLTNPNFPESR
jgi:hypothetical protein